MKKLLALAIVAACAVPTFAVTLNFDDLIGAAPMTDGYGGANWSNGGWNYYDSPQSPYDAHSGATRVYSSLGFTGEIDFLSQVTLTGAWLNGYGTSAGHGPIQFDMYLGGNLVAQSALIDLDGSDTPQFLASGYNGAIDRVDVKAQIVGDNFFTMDDLTFNAVPEPASLVVLGAGIVAMARLRRKA